MLNSLTITAALHRFRLAHLLGIGLNIRFCFAAIGLNVIQFLEEEREFNTVILTEPVTEESRITTSN